MQESQKTSGNDYFYQATVKWLKMNFIHHSLFYQFPYLGFMCKDDKDSMLNLDHQS